MDQAERIKRLKEQAIYADFMRKKSQQDNYKPMSISYGQIQQIKSGANSIVKENAGTEFTIHITVKQPNTKISIGGKARALDIDWSDKNIITELVENVRAGPLQFTYTHNYAFMGNYIIRVVNVKALTDLYIEYEDNVIDELVIGSLGAMLKTLELRCDIESLEIQKLEELTSLIVHSPTLHSIGSFPSAKIERLVLPNAQLEHIDIRNLTELRHLDVRNNKLAVLNVAGLEHLEIIDMAHNPVGTFVFDGCVGLKHINANSCKMTKENIGALLMALVTGPVTDGFLDLTNNEKPDIVARSNLAVLGSKSRRWNIIMPIR